MNQGEVKTPVRSDAVLTPAKKAAVVMAAAGVMGFCVGWGMSMMLNPEARLYLSMVGLVVGATIGWLIGRLGNKTAA